MIGEQFNEYGSEITGVVISVRHHDYVLSLWTKNADNTDAVFKIRDMMKKNLKLPAFVPLEYKRHDTAVSESSSSAAASSSRGRSVMREAPGMGQPNNNNNNNANHASSNPQTSSSSSSSAPANSAPAWRERNPLVTSTGAGESSAAAPSAAWR